MSGALIALVYGGPLLVAFAALAVMRSPFVQRLARRHRGMAGNDFTLACTCAARLTRCDCAIAGTRNPRGAGRGRKAVA